MPNHERTNPPAREWTRLQLRFDELLRLPEDQDPTGPTGPPDEQLARGREMFRVYFSGTYHVVREYLRPSIEPVRDPSLTLGDCVRSMKRIVADLETLETAALERVAIGAYRARRYILQTAGLIDATASHHNTPHGATKNKPQVSQAEAAEERLSSSRGFDYAHAYASALNAAVQDIEELRDEDPTPHATETTSPATACSPTTSASTLPRLTRMWIVYYATGTAHLIGGPHGPAMATVVDPTISPQNCLKGLRRVHDRMARLAPADRTTVFELMDEAYNTYIPEFRFTETR